MSNPRFRTHAGYLRYKDPNEKLLPVPTLDGETQEQRLKRILRNMPAGTFESPSFLVKALKRANSGV